MKRSTKKFIDQSFRREKIEYQLQNTTLREKSRTSD